METPEGERRYSVESDYKVAGGYHWVEDSVTGDKLFASDRKDRGATDLLRHKLERSAPPHLMPREATEEEIRAAHCDSPLWRAKRKTNATLWSELQDARAEIADLKGERDYALVSLGKAREAVLIASLEAATPDESHREAQESIVVLQAELAQANHELLGAERRANALMDGNLGLEREIADLKQRAEEGAAGTDVLFGAVRAALEGREESRLSVLIDDVQGVVDEMDEMRDVPGRQGTHKTWRRLIKALQKARGDDE